MIEPFHHLIIGIGNEYRRDDAAGLIVARRLRKLVPNEINIIEQSGEGAVLMETWKGAENVVLIDAVHSGAAPGTIFRFKAHAQPLPTKFFHYSTHAFSIAEAIELARALKQLPPSLVVYGIEGKSFAAGVGLSAEVEKAVREVAERIQQEFA
jgi:hydrogenase maturation protease